MIGHRAVSGRKHVRQIGAHRAVHGDGAADSQGGAGGRGQIDIGPDPDEDENDVGITPERSAVAGCALDAQPRSRPRVGARDALHRCAGHHVDTMDTKLRRDGGTELGVDGGEHLGKLLDLGHLQAPDDECFSHL